MTKLQLPSGITYGIDAQGNRVCTGTQSGRRNSLYPYTNSDIKLHLQHLPLVDGCYDKWGAYWGGPDNLYCAWNDLLNTYIFIRATHRDHAKQTIRHQFYKNAVFYR